VDVDCTEEFTLSKEVVTGNDSVDGSKNVTRSKKAVTGGDPVERTELWLSPFTWKNKLSNNHNTTANGIRKWQPGFSSTLAAGWPLRGEKNKRGVVQAGDNAKDIDYKENGISSTKEIE